MDPWCLKCPFFLECIRDDVRPGDMACEGRRLVHGLLTVDQTWIGDMMRIAKKMLTGR